ncbi:MAG TPA: rod shape-determining protein MreC [Mycobacteriales bacterium]|nr:rod shape-determining protein MreC [Mycobacteriales bacterium]
MHDRPRLLLVALLLASITLTALDAREGSPFDPLRRGVDAVLGPVDSAVGGAASAVGEAVSAVGDLADRDEFERLREENARLRRQLAEGEGDARAAEQLRSLLGQADELRLLPARVTAAGGALGFERTVTLDAGERDGVRPGQSVVSADGLVGRTVRVGPWTSTVLLVDDPEFGAGARLAGTGALGLARGAGPGRAEWTQVEPGPVAEGEVVVTSGSDTFAPGLAIGRVRSVRPTAGGLTRTAVVDVLADLGSLALVGIVLDEARSGPRQPLPTP